MPRVNLTRQIKRDAGWKRVPLERDARGRIRWGNGEGRYLIEWRERGRRLRGAAGRTPAEALEAQRRRRLELEAKENNLELLGLPKEEDNVLLDHALRSFLRDIKAFRKPLTLQKYEYIVGLFCEHVVPKRFAREITPEDIKAFPSWRKSKGFDPGTTLCTDRVILHNFFSTLKIENPVKEVPRLPRLRKRPMAYTDADLKKFFEKCDSWERTFFALALAGGLRRGELKTLHWSDLDLARKRVHITAKPSYEFIPKDWEEPTVPLGKRSRGATPKASAKTELSFGFPCSERKAKLSVSARSVQSDRKACGTQP